MNHYKHHIGDYAQATAHLTLLEDGVYSRFIRKYYAEEKPLPVDVKACQRLVGARTKEEKEAVVSVLEEFFELQEDGWHNKRCDEELAEYKKRAEFNRSVGAKGGRPKKEPERLSENNPGGFKAETQTVSENNPSHKPLAISHKPEPNGESGVNNTSRSAEHISKTTLPPNFGISPEIEAWAKTKDYTADLPAYLEAFKLKCQANGYQKSNWDSAFKTSMLEDWGKVRERSKSGGKSLRQLLEEEEENATR